MAPSSVPLSISFAISLTYLPFDLCHDCTVHWAKPAWQKEGNPINRGHYRPYVSARLKVTTVRSTLSMRKTHRVPSSAQIPGKVSTLKCWFCAQASCCRQANTSLDFSWAVLGGFGWTRWFGGTVVAIWTGGAARKVSPSAGWH